MLSSSSMAYMYWYTTSSGGEGALGDGRGRRSHSSHPCHPPALAPGKLGHEHRANNVYLLCQPLSSSSVDPSAAPYLALSPEANLSLPAK
ncbi:hypothetical protein FKM82_019627 [Ascaphus truei]